MNKERLEEIEEHILKIDEDDSANRSKMLDYRHWTYELLKIASEQAERVQELEEDCEYLSHHYGLEAEQNKRYREAIIEALHGLKTLPSVAPRLYLISILDKALEGVE